MAAKSIETKIMSLGGLEIAMLLGLVAEQPCLVQAPPECLDSTVNLIVDTTIHRFGLHATCVTCHETISTDEFGRGLLMPVEAQHHSPRDHGFHGFRRPSHRTENSGSEAAGTRANVIIAKNLSDAPEVVQMQALELIRTREMLAQSSMHTAPSPFLFLALNKTSSRPLAKHLNDFMFISHLETLDHAEESDVSTQASNAHSENRESAAIQAFERSSMENILKMDIDHLRQARDNVAMTVEMKRYIYNIVVFLRMHRAVAGGVTAKASRDFEILAKCLAPLNSLTFVTPSVVALAARKIYRHRLQVASVSEDRSMQYGSDALAVAKVLAGQTPESIIGQVLDMVDVPL